MLFKTLFINKKVKFSTPFEKEFNLYKRRNTFLIEINFIKNKHSRIIKNSLIKSFYEKFIEFLKDNLYISSKYNEKIKEVTKRFSFSLKRIEKEDW